MKIEEMSVVLTGFLFVCLKDFITTSGYKQFIENSVILLAVFAAFIVQQYVSSGKPNLFRLGDAGLWACLLLPSVANGMEMEDRSLLWTLALATLVSYVYSEGLTMSRLWCILIVVVYTCLTANLMYQKPIDALIIAVCCMVYMYMLHNISSWFKRSFTFGEASVVVQLYVCQTYRGIRNIKGSDPLEKVTVVSIDF
ncbi:uncharacterized protein LOC128545937 [Mercenaria mercenaria]|uniref:uncharacterized protein LOC128545937 n=1 Tax=Mercenaria mercenaria TaxID=6596 RepID=UPI00234F68DD|nr:uncharacterized protein LOC128545937 [Mercenaria mercenaria]